MTFYNKVILGGRLTRDPETRSIGDSVVCNFTLAVDRRTKKGGGWTTEPVFVQCAI